MAELRVQPGVLDFVEKEYGDRGLSVLKKAVKKMNSMLEWTDSPADVAKIMDGSFSIEGASILKKYVSGPQEAWRMAVKQVDDGIYAVEMFTTKNDEDLLLRQLQERF